MPNKAKKRMVIYMIKKCRQCGSQLKPSESNEICEKCRKQKRDAQAEVNLKRKRRKSKIG